MTKARGRTLLMVLVIAALVAVASPAAVAQDAAPTVVFPVQLSGPDPEGQGMAILRLEPAEGTLCYEIMVKGIGEPTEPAPGLGNAHIHGPLPSTGIAVHLETEFMQAGASDVFLASGCVNVDAATVEAILANPELFYVNVHTVEFPGGAVQGTLA